jgi:hypothetical protein
MIIRSKTNRNYTVINNTILNDSRLSWKARGLAAYLLTKPDNWNISREHLETQAPDGSASVRSALKELRNLGYITSEPGRTTDGRFRWDTVLHEIPQTVVAENVPVENPPAQHKTGVVLAGNAPVENMPVENMPVENRRLVSTVVVKTEKATTEEQKGARGATPVQPPAKPATPPAPAVAIWCELTGLQPNQSQSALIAQTVTDCDLWRTRLTEWLASDYKPTSVRNQLDVYANGWQRKAPGANGHQPEPPSEPKSTRRLAQLVPTKE